MPTWEFQFGVVNHLMRRQFTDRFKCIPTRFPTFVDVFTCIVEDPVYEVHVVLQITLVIEQSGTAITFDLQLGVVRLLMLHQRLGHFICLPTRDSVIVDVITNVVKGACDVVDMVLQITLVIEFSCTTPTLDFQFGVVLLLLMFRHNVGLFKCLPTRFHVLVDMVTHIMVDPCDVVHVVL